MTEPKYWIVGATWDGDDDQSPKFLLRGYWLLGWSDADKPALAALRNQISVNDRIAIKKMLGQGSSEIQINAIGIVKDIEGRYIYVEWILREMSRRVESKGCYGSIHGPYDFDSDWIKEVFKI
jgi:hypothetical protein